jgi:hypothetical protein
VVKGRVAAGERRDRWAAWTGRPRIPSGAAETPESLRERQYRAKLVKRVKPRSPAPEWEDPWELANGGIHELLVVREALRRGGMAELMEKADLALETMRQLAWGPSPPQGVAVEATRPSAVRKSGS